MSSRSKTKGVAFERSLLPLIRAYHPYAIRTMAGNTADTGDAYMPGNELYIVEAKNHVTLDLPKWLREAKREAANAGVPYGVIVHKRVNTTKPEDQWATMTFGDWLSIVHRQQ